MKKHILLALLSVFLSAPIMKANADSNSAILNMFVVMMEPFEITKEKYLGFGMILEAEAGRKVIVTPDGKLGEGSTATMMSTASLANQMTTEAHVGSFNEAVFRIKGGFSEVVRQWDTDLLNAGILVNFADTSVELKSLYQSKTCGTVTDFTKHIETADNNELILHIGGTLTTATLGTGTNHGCFGSTTVTLVINDEIFSQASGM